MEKEEFRVLNRHCFLRKKNTVETKEWLDKYYSTSAPSKSTVCNWFDEFKRGRLSTDDIPSSGRPNEAVSPENIKNPMLLFSTTVKLKFAR